ncbi:hypothetical protein [Archaeoglobus veneficus]|uniref:Uncharacterized protein n=1 Tax=Archaeoglobus veneficus (strain DSM 11195 / SNP6) TaxID=693661 RepID=F2KSV5_ARCVS|nr:hypothetical protein [Archaeoglobus veneficus]AEA47000.1 hypothetical protein Arcve_0989 [Archaeoglobus veneficus SNP6]
MLSVLTLIGFFTSIVGLIGYVLVPSGTLTRHEKYLRGAAGLYVALSFSFLLHSLCHLLSIDVLLADCIMGAITASAGILLFIQFMERGVSISLPRLREILLYMSVVWLMGKEIPLSLLEPYIVVTTGVLSFFIFAVTILLLIFVKKHRIFLILEDVTTLISESFTVVLLTGVGLISLGSGVAGGNIHVLSSLLAATVLTHVLDIIYRTSSPFFRRLPTLV